MKLSQIITTFFLSLTCLTTYAQKGTWSGKIIIQGMELPLVFNFNDNNCTLDSPSQGINNISAEKSVDEDGTIKVFIKMIGATFEGKNVGECIEGTFTQNGFHFPLTLHAGKPTINRVRAYFLAPNSNKRINTIKVAVTKFSSIISENAVHTQQRLHHLSLFSQRKSKGRHQ